jgi:hypothetical protein
VLYDDPVLSNLIIVKQHNISQSRSDPTLEVDEFTEPNVGRDMNGPAPHHQEEPEVILCMCSVSDIPWHCGLTTVTLFHPMDYYTGGGGGWAYTLQSRVGSKDILSSIPQLGTPGPKVRNWQCDACNMKGHGIRTCPLVPYNQERLKMMSSGKKRGRLLGSRNKNSPGKRLPCTRR